MDLSSNKLTLQGSAFVPLREDRCRLSLFDREGKKYPIELHEAPADEFSVMPDILQKYNFFVHFELKKETDLYFAAITDDGIYPVDFSCGRRFPLTHGLSHSHCCLGSWHFHIEGYKIIVQKRSYLFDLKKQLGLWVELFRKRKRTSLLCHIFIYLLSLFPKQKEIWIFSDRAGFAGDNGEYLFKYVNIVKDKKIKTYFSIEADSPDYRNLIRNNKNIIANNSKKFKFLYLRADKLISSHFDDANLAPLHEHEEFLKDLIHSKRIYLQHGIIKDDLTRDNGKLYRNINGFVTSSKEERQSLLSLPYGYLSDEVWLTGLARYDEIYDCGSEHKKVIVIAPTWRDYFTFKHWSSADGLLEKDPEFLETEYFKFYNDLLNDETLLNSMRKNGYTGVFRPHPVMMHFFQFFEENDVFSVEMRSRNYRDEISATALFITDYSSMAFDYAYVYRPCIYAQFDKEKFISGHTYKPGYFDYERGGFGPVCYDYDSTIRTIIEAIENGCVMEEKYHERAEKFFAYRDGKNCERIYQEILKLEEGR